MSVDIFSECHLFTHMFPFGNEDYNESSSYSKIELSCLYFQDVVNGVLFSHDLHYLTFEEMITLDISVGLLLYPNTCSSYPLPNEVIDYFKKMKNELQHPLIKIISDISETVQEYQELFLMLDLDDTNRCVVSYVLSGCKSISLLCSTLIKKITCGSKNKIICINDDEYNGIRKNYYCLLKCFYALSLVVKWNRDKVCHLKSFTKHSCNFDAFWIDVSYLFYHIFSTGSCQFTFEQLLRMYCKHPADIYLIASLFQYDIIDIHTFVNSEIKLETNYTLRRNWIFNNRIKSYLVRGHISNEDFLKVFPEEIVFQIETI